MWKPTLNKSESSLFSAIVRALERDVAGGALEPGQRLPTHRELADLLGVARGTVARAYAEAERLGILRSEIGRGTFVGSPLGAEPYRALRGAGPGVIDLSVNHPLYDLDPDLAGALGRLSRSPIQDLLRYQPQTGLPRHRAAGVTWLARCGVSATAEEVLPCSGGQHAMTMVLSLVAEQGDLVLTESLTYPGIRAIADMLRLKLQGVPIDEQGLIPEELEAACRSRTVRALYTVPTLQNPTASILPLERRREIARIAARYDVPIVEDDIHRLYAEDPPPTLKSLAPEHVYYVGSLAKTLAGGLRVAFLAPPPGKMDLLADRMLATIWMSPPLTLTIASQWIEDGTADDVARRKREELRGRHAVLRDVLGGWLPPTDDTSLFVWLPLPAGRGSAEFAMEAREGGVAVTPSQFFHIGAGPTPDGVRICLGAAPDRDSLASAAEILSRLLEGRAPRRMAMV